MVKHGNKLRKKLDSKPTDFMSECYFHKGDKIFLCSDGIADNLSNLEISNFVYTFRDSRECLKNIVNGIYEIEKQKLQHRTNNPPSYLKDNNNFTSTLKGSEDNISGIIIENESEGR